MHIPKSSCYSFIFFIFILNNSQVFSGSIAKCTENEPNSEIILDSTTGKLRGNCRFVRVNDNNSNEIKSGNVYSWLSVPYAEPPIDTLRFKRTVAKKPWSNTLSATDWPNTCIQQEQSEFIDKKDSNGSFPGFEMWEPSSKHTNFSEDCLYLNIWTPAEAYLRINIQTPSATYQQLKSPIMVYFHGGGTVSGSSSLDIYDPSTFVAATNTIVITINYRLGVFGFLHLDGEFPGNQALYDQHEALKWIHMNAERFGGDSSKITIVGQSAGASLAGFHLFFKESWPLFRNIILQSGTPLTAFTTPISGKEANNRAKHLLTYAGCDIRKSNSEIALCAQKSDKIIKSTITYFESSTNFNLLTQSYLSTLFPPVIDSQSITETPLVSLKTGNFKKCPILTGFTTDEGSMFVAYTNHFKDMHSEPHMSHSALVDYLKNYFAFYPNFPELSNKLIINSILHEYSKTLESKIENATENYFSNLTKIVGDQLIKCPTYEFIDLAAQFNSQIYLYLFAHRVSSTPWPRSYGVVHGDDLSFTFAHSISEKRDEAKKISVNPWSSPKLDYTQREKNLTNEMIGYWSNFARFNTPNRPSKKHWPEYTSNKIFDEQENEYSDNETKPGRYIIFKTSDIKIKQGYSVEICKFWNNYLPNLMIEIENLVKERLANQPKPLCPTTVAAKYGGMVRIPNSAQRAASFSLIKEPFLFLLMIFILNSCL